MNWKAKILRALAFVTLLPALFGTPAFGDEFCSGLQRIVSDIGNRFENLRGDFRSLDHDYYGTVEMGPLNFCVIRISNNKLSAQYSCMLDSGSDDAEEANARWQELDSEIVACLGSKIKRDATIEHAFHYRTVPDGDRLTLAYWLPDDEDNDEKKTYMFAFRADYYNPNS